MKLKHLIIGENRESTNLDSNLENLILEVIKNVENIVENDNEYLKGIKKVSSKLEELGAKEFINKYYLGFIYWNIKEIFNEINTDEILKEYRKIFKDLLQKIFLLIKDTTDYDVEEKDKNFKENKYIKGDTILVKMNKLENKENLTENEILTLIKIKIFLVLDDFCNS